MTLDECVQEVHRLDPTLPKSDPAFQVALILIASLVVGPSIERIAEFTGIKRKELSVVSMWLRESGVWKLGRVDVDWFNEEGGGVAFWMDVSVGLGHVQRSA